VRALESKINQGGVGDPKAIYKISQAYAMLGDSNAALRALRRSIESGFFSYAYFVTDPLLDSLRNGGDFSQLMNAAHRRHEDFKRLFF